MTKQELITRMDEIEETYRVFYAAVFPEITLERKSYEARSLTELEELAESLSAPFQAKEDVLSEEKTAAVAKIAEEVAALPEKYALLSDKAQEKYDGAVEDLDKDAASRGMTRSAWYLARKSALYASLTAELSRLSAEETAKAAELSAKSADVAADYDAKIAEAEAEYGAFYAKTLEELTAAERETVDKVLEYNNETAQKEGDFNLRSMEAAYDHANKDTNTSPSMIYEKIEACKEYLESFTASAALDKLQTDELFTERLSPWGRSALIAYYAAQIPPETDGDEE